MADDVEVSKGRILAHLSDAVTRSDVALNRIGAMISTRGQIAFDEQKRGDVEWPARAVPNVAGIVTDLETGTEIPERRFEDRPAGVDTAGLKNSLSWELEERATAVEIGTNKQGASLIQYGGEVEVSVTMEVQQKLRAWGLRNPGRWPQVQFLAPGYEYTLRFEVPPRPFIMVDQADREDIRSIILDVIHGR